jgi:hypothetical protein
VMVVMVLRVLLASAPAQLATVASPIGVAWFRFTGRSSAVAGRLPPQEGAALRPHDRRGLRLAETASTVEDAGSFLRRGLSIASHRRRISPLKAPMHEMVCWCGVASPAAAGGGCSVMVPLR